MLESIRKALMHAHIFAVSDALELVAGVLRLRLRTIAEEVSEQLVPFYRWRDARVVTDPAILGGEPVLPAAAGRDLMNRVLRIWSESTHEFDPPPRREDAHRSLLTATPGPAAQA